MNKYDEVEDAGNDGFESESARQESALFPLPMLAFVRGRDALLSWLLVYSVMRFAEKTYEDARKKRDRAKLLSLPVPAFSLNGFDESNLKHRAVGDALVRFNRTAHSLKPIFADYKKCTNFLRERGLLEGQPHVLASIKLLDPRNNNDLSELDLRVLFAINSVIGLKRYPIRITARHIAIRAVGAKDSMTLRRLRPNVPTERQVRYSLDKLVRKGFFHREVLRKRITFVAKKRVVSKEQFGSYVKRWEKRHLRPARKSQ